MSTQTVRPVAPDDDGVSPPARQAPDAAPAGAAPRRRRRLRVEIQTSCS
ncbi:hypothetical protein [Isoptericola sp. NPDC057391]